MDLKNIKLKPNTQMRQDKENYRRVKTQDK